MYSSYFSYFYSLYFFIFLPTSFDFGFTYFFSRLLFPFRLFIYLVFSSISSYVLFNPLITISLLTLLLHLTYVFALKALFQDISSYVLFISLSLLLYLYYNLLSFSPFFAVNFINSFTSSYLCFHLENSVSGHFHPMFSLFFSLHYYIFIILYFLSLLFLLWILWTLSRKKYF